MAKIGGSWGKIGGVWAKNAFCGGAKRKFLSAKKIASSAWSHLWHTNYGATNCIQIVAVTLILPTEYQTKKKTYLLFFCSIRAYLLPYRVSNQIWFIKWVSSISHIPNSIFYCQFILLLLYWVILNSILPNIT